MKTRFHDKNFEPIYIGDILHVEEYPDRFVGGSLNFEGVVELDNNGTVVITYYDIGEQESFPLSAFPRNGRLVLCEEERYKYWRTAFLGGEPPEELWKREIYTKKGEI